ncbi:8977_t:CDS:2, partial [Paraglomus occultum]
VEENNVSVLVCLKNYQYQIKKGDNKTKAEIFRGNLTSEIPTYHRRPQANSSLLEDTESIEPFEVFVKNTEENGLDYPSKLQLNYPRTVNRVRLKEHLGVLSSKAIGELRKAWQCREAKGLSKEEDAEEDRGWIKFKHKGETYQIIDTPGIGDTKLEQSQVLNEITKGYELVEDGIHQVLFVVGGQFTPEEVMTFNTLKRFFFDENANEYTTIVRTRFNNFEDENECEKDADLLLSSSCGRRVIHVDNPPIDIVGGGRRKERQIALNKEIREASREKLLKYLDSEEWKKVYRLKIKENNNKNEFYPVQTRDQGTQTGLTAQQITELEELKEQIQVLVNK